MTMVPSPFVGILLFLCSISAPATSSTTDAVTDFTMSNISGRIIDPATDLAPDFSLNADTSFVPNYRWPVDVSRHLSGTFGETRSAHFHSGLDIKTWGREGYPVFATEEGYISRMAISARGYGKVLYVTHPNGYTSVYAHLQRFSPELQAYIDSVRMARGYRFEIDIDLGYASNTQSRKTSGHLFPVTRGQRIAYTGSTGIGPPHLHFELRNPQERALNVLEFGITIKDQIPPTIRSLMVIPLAANSRVEGLTERQVFGLVSTDPDFPNHAHFGRIGVQGPVGVAFDIFDGADEVNNKYAFYQAWLVDHGQERSTSSADTVVYQRIDAVDFEDGGAMFFDRLSPPSSRRRSFQAFFPQDGPEIPFYKTMKSSPGVGLALNAEPGQSRRFELIVQDYFGNESRANYLLEVDEPDNHNQKDIAEYASNIHPSDWQWKPDWIAVSDSLSWSLEANNPDWVLAPFSTSQTGHWFQDQTIHTIRRVNPEQPHRVSTHDQRIRWYAHPHTFPDTLSMGVFHDEILPTNHTAHPIPILGILPLALPQQKPITVEWFIGDYLEGYRNQEGHIPQQLGLYRYDPEEQGYARISSRILGGTLRARISGSGLFTLWADTLAPKAFNLRVQPTVFGTTGVYLRFDEEHSGILTQESTITVNNQKGIIEFDYEEETMLYYRPAWTAQRGDTLEISYQILDGAGNRVERQTTHIVR